jgi:sarcosine dehydrogenase
VPLWGLEAIWRDDQVVGFLRRADYAFTLNKSIGYGYIRRPDGLPVTNDFLLSGDYSIESMDVKHKAHVHLKTPFDPKNLRVAGFY